MDVGLIPLVCRALEGRPAIYGHCPLVTAQQLLAQITQPATTVVCGEVPLVTCWIPALPGGRWLGFFPFYYGEPRLGRFIFLRLYSQYLEKSI